MSNPTQNRFKNRVCIYPIFIQERLHVLWCNVKVYCIKTRRSDPFIKKDKRVSPRCGSDCTTLIWQLPLLAVQRLHAFLIWFHQLCFYSYIKQSPVAFSETLLLLLFCCCTFLLLKRICHLLSFNFRPVTSVIARWAVPAAVVWTWRGCNIKLWTNLTE